jgi:hypothetical protein
MVYGPTRSTEEEFGNVILHVAGSLTPAIANLFEAVHGFESFRLIFIIYESKIDFNMHMSYCLLIHVSAA